MTTSINLHTQCALFIACILWVFSAPVLAHSGAGQVGGFVSGFMHPVLGWDHLVAMVAVGLWGAFLGAPAIYILPVVFPLVMTLGGAAGIVGVPLVGVEIGIAVSSVVIGLLVAFAVKAPLWIVALIVGIFAIFHGHAHGTELPHAVNATTFAIGFVVATGLLHLLGIAIGLLVAAPGGSAAVRVLGAGIAIVGVKFFVGAV
ncbi:MAG: HupE/UreJ family protein [Halioglobus sp.]|nr:HupE/UreJ family protein [Halioglobus sp.]